MNNWLFVESLFNWENDFRTNFEYLGIRIDVFDKKKFQTNDCIYTYISKLKKFSDIRQISSNDIFDLPNNYKYDKEYIKGIKTKPIKVLDKKNWLDFNQIKNELELFSLTNSPGLKLINAPIKLSNFDSKKLDKFFNLT